MKTHHVHTSGKHLGLILKAFGMIEGKKSIMLSYKFGRILEPVRDLQGEFINRLRPFIDAQGNLLEDLTDEQREEVEAIVDEDLTFEIPDVTIQEIVQASISGLVVSDDSVLPYLVDQNIILDNHE
jgi:hypothetical protein